MKKIIATLLAFACFCSFSVPVFANPSDSKQSAITYSEKVTDEITCVTTISWSSNQLRTSGRNGSISREYYYSGKCVASVVLNADFTYDGTTATAITASGSHLVASGWSYSGQSTWCSGATAYLTATISGPVSIPVSLSLTCSPGGALS